MIVHSSAVEVRERIREELGEDEIAELMSSFLALGQLQPIVVKPGTDGKYELVAGERRLVSCRRLAESGKSIKDHEIGYIKIEIVGQLSPHVQLQMEFDENMKRKDFTYVEKARFIRRFHETMEAQAKEVGGSWSAELTAVSLRLSPASISHYLRIEEAIKTDPSVAKAITMSAAVKRMKVAEKQRARQIEVKTNDNESYTAAESILGRGDALELIRGIPDASVDLVNFDPPWGDNTNRKSNENWDGFDDDTETSDRVINGLLPELYRVLKEDRIMIFWYRTWAYQDMVQRLEHACCDQFKCLTWNPAGDPDYRHATSFNLKFVRTPCVWHKPDKVSDQNRFPEKMLIDAYENFILARKGDPIFHERNWQNVFVHPRVPLAALIHPTEKPISLCSDLLRLLTVPGELVLDPTAGSTAMLHASLINNRRAKGFELSETIHSRGVTRLAEYLKTRKEVKL